MKKTKSGFREYTMMAGLWLGIAAVMPGPAAKEVRALLREGETPQPPEAVLIIGQQKAASTETYFALLAVLHENATDLAHEKELGYFSYPLPCLVDSPRGCDDQLAYYASNQRYFIDATPDYFADALAFAQIHRALPSAKLVVVMRDPVDRAQAAWLQNVRQGGDVRPFAEAVHQEMFDLWERCAPPPRHVHGESVLTSAAATVLARHVSAVTPWYVVGGPSGAAWQLDEVREVAAPTQSHAALAAHCVREWHEDWLRWRDDCGSCHQYLVRGLVARKLQTWRAAYGANLLVLQTEDIEVDLGRAARRLATFLGMPGDLDAAQQAKLARTADEPCWHGCDFISQFAADLGANHSALNQADELLLTAFYARDRAELLYLEPALRWPRFSQLEAVPPPPLSPPLAMRLAAAA